MGGGGDLRERKKKQQHFLKERIYVLLKYEIGSPINESLS
jgi:hypothetical protein